MLTSMLFVAAVEAAGHADAASSGITQIAQDFGIDLPFILAQAVNFVIVAAVLWYFAFKPVMATIEERKAKIAAGLKFAEDAKAQLDSAHHEHAAIVKNAQMEAARYIDEARKTAKEFSERETAAATERANGIITKAQQAIELEHRKMLEEVRGEIAHLVIATTQRVLSKELTDAERSRYNDSVARELSNV